MLCFDYRVARLKVYEVTLNSVLIGTLRSMKDTVSCYIDYTRLDRLTPVHLSIKRGPFFNFPFPLSSHLRTTQSSSLGEKLEVPLAEGDQQVRHQCQASVSFGNEDFACIGLRGRSRECYSTIRDMQALMKDEVSN